MDRLVRLLTRSGGRTRPLRQLGRRCVVDVLADDRRAADVACDESLGEEERGACFVHYALHDGATGPRLIGAGRFSDRVLDATPKIITLIERGDRILNSFPVVI